MLEVNETFLLAVCGTSIDSQRERPVSVARSDESKVLSKEGKNMIQNGFNGHADRSGNRTKNIGKVKAFLIGISAVKVVHSVISYIFNRSVSKKIPLVENLINPALTSNLGIEYFKNLSTLIQNGFERQVDRLGDRIKKMGIIKAAAFAISVVAITYFAVMLASYLIYKKEKIRATSGAVIETATKLKDKTRELEEKEKIHQENINSLLKEKINLEWRTRFLSCLLINAQNALEIKKRNFEQYKKEEIKRLEEMSLEQAHKLVEQSKEESRSSIAASNCFDLFLT